MTRCAGLREAPCAPNFLFIFFIAEIEIVTLNNMDFGADIDENQVFGVTQATTKKVRRPLLPIGVDGNENGRRSAYKKRLVCCNYVCARSAGYFEQMSSRQQMKCISVPVSELESCNNKTFDLSPSAAVDHADNKDDVIVVVPHMDRARIERQMKRQNGFNLDLAVCNTHWDTATRATIGHLEAVRLAIGVEGEKQIKRLFGGVPNSDHAEEVRLGPHVDIPMTKKLLNNSLSASSSDDGNHDVLRPVTEDNQWVVEKILKKRVTVENKKRVVSYLLKWVGWDYNLSTWEEHNQDNNLDKLAKKFERRSKWRKTIYERESRSCQASMFKHNNRFKCTYMNWMFNRPVFNACHRWEDEMNGTIRQWKTSSKCKKAPIYVENWVDDEFPPTNFEFILENIFSESVEQAMLGFMKLEFCMCKANGIICGAVEDCCSEIFGQQYCYGEDDKLVSGRARKNWIVECTDGCSCDINCPSRVVQRGRQIPLVIFRTVDRGWSVRTTIYIERHKFVCEYIGQVLTVDEAFMKNMPSTYQFQMDGAGEHKLKFVVDAFKCGNEARFINHSCSPNLDVRPVFADRLDECYHRIAFFAKRDIKIGEELTIDYCAIDGNAQGRQKTECTCRALKCRGFFYY